MPLTSQDFERVRIGLEDLAKALKDNTQALSQGARGTGGAPGAAGGAGGGGRRGGAGGEKKKKEEGGIGGFALSASNKLASLAPAAAQGPSSLTNAMGGLVGGLSKTLGPGAALLGGAISQLGQDMGRSQSNMQASLNANFGTYAGSTNLTAKQAEIAASGAGFKAENEARMKYAAEQAASSWTDDSKRKWGEEGALAAKAEYGRARAQEDRLDPQLRARADVDRVFGRAIDNGALETKQGRETFERLYKFYQGREERAQRGRRLEDKLIDKLQGSGGGAAAGQQAGHALR